jgi:hypothetical protein
MKFLSAPSNGRNPFLIGKRALITFGLSLATLGTAPLGQCQTNCIPAPSGLVSWWRAETNATDAIDGNSGVLFGNTGFGLGKVGSAFAFDGATAHVHIADRPNLHLTNGLTIEGWIFPNRLGIHQAIVCKWDLSFQFQKSYCTALQPDGRVYICLRERR